MADEPSKKQRKAIPAATKRAVMTLFIQGNHLCPICDCEIKPYHAIAIDHIVPVSKGGTNDLDNLQVLHYVCNRFKDTHTTKEAWLALDNIVRWEEGWDRLFKERKGDLTIEEQEAYIFSHWALYGPTPPNQTAFAKREELELLLQRLGITYEEAVELRAFEQRLRRLGITGLTDDELVDMYRQYKDPDYMPPGTRTLTPEEAMEVLRREGWFTNPDDEQKL